MFGMKNQVQKITPMEPLGGLSLAQTMYIQNKDLEWLRDVVTRSSIIPEVYLEIFDLQEYTNINLGINFIIKRFNDFKPVYSDKFLC